MRRYKANLGVVSGRYGDLERRVLQYFVDHPEKNTVTLFGGHEFFLSYLIQDGIIIDTGAHGGIGMDPGGDMADEPTLWSHLRYALTDKGRTFLQQWVGGGDLENAG